MIRIINPIKILSMLIMTGIFCLANTATGQTTHGFRLIEKRFVKEVNADCYFYEHVQSGAQLFKVANDDDNKLFCITFKTVPYSDNGIAHIMEHSVLNGSTNFPVKSPFDVLSKGSLKTFLNAMTSKDYTKYPVASMNDKDYFNLMHVYLDAVFNPLIYSDDRILKQEGWHHELLAKDGPLTYKGVVYNEMKGAYSSPTRELSYQMFKNLFPDNLYGWESGGYPAAIPQLTQDEFEAFHKKYYAPENSYIFLYGNADLDKELEFINREYLSKYTKTGNKAVIEDQPAFSAMKRVEAFYPMMEGKPTKDQTYLTLSLVAGQGTDEPLTMALDLICDLLFNQESAPVRLALQQAGIGKDLGGYSMGYKQNVIMITAQNANPEDSQRFYDIVMNTIRETIAKGFDKKEVEGLLNRNEFYLREGADAQKGLTYSSRNQSNWFFTGDPFRGLEYEKTLAEVKQALTTRYLEDIAQRCILDNTHALLLTLAPKPGMEKANIQKTDAELAALKSKMSETEMDQLIKENNELIAFQKREDTPEALATVPMLSLSDINPKANYFACTETKAGNTKVLHYDDFTNNILYLNMYFDLNVLTQEELPYASLLAHLIGMLDTEGYTYGDLDREFNIHTGGFSTYLKNWLPDQDDQKMKAAFVVNTKLMNNKADKMFELAGEMLLKTKFADTARIHTLLERHQAQLEASLQRDGSGVAGRRLPSYFTLNGQFNEMTEGLDYFWFISDLAKAYNSDAAAIIAKLQQVAARLFNSNNVFCTLSCAKADLKPFNNSLKKFVETLPGTPVTTQSWSFKPIISNEGILTTSKVQYVIQGYDFKKLGYSWNGNMRVLNQVLSTDWLKNQLRVIGGAYGGYSSVQPNGIFTLNSYRDPNLQATIDNYAGTVNYLKDFKADEAEMTRYIIGTVSRLDVPLTTPQKGNYAFNYYLNGTTAADVQKERDQVLSSTANDIRNYADLIQKIVDQKAICVYGNTEKIKAEQSSLKKLIKIEKE